MGFDLDEDNEDTILHGLLECHFAASLTQTFECCTKVADAKQWFTQQSVAVQACKLSKLYSNRLRYCQTRQLSPQLPQAHHRLPQAQCPQQHQSPSLSHLLQHLKRKCPCRPQLLYPKLKPPRPWSQASAKLADKQPCTSPHTDRSLFQSLAR